MRKWIIALVVIAAAIIAGFAVSTYVVFSPFLDMAGEIDAINSADLDAVARDIMMHPASVAFTEKYPSYTHEISNLGVGGFNHILVADKDGSQLTINLDTDGEVTNIVYICFMPGGGSDSIDGPGVAERIPDLCS